MPQGLKPHHSFMGFERPKAEALGYLEAWGDAGRSTVLRVTGSLGAGLGRASAVSMQVQLRILSG